ncbi:MAG TPA: TrkH family potassium uptake protein [Bacillota bacterium]|nr:TrkH family potassium uptake protein [Fastidiosipila sp.]HPX93619.1 TrkH family potassium uptake protein [Bacillota bacterium]HQB81521.1 TrkH family potassium uptake protein [Bacillota bacterium]
MNFNSVRYVQGRIFQICSLLLLLPLVVALVFGEIKPALQSFGLVAVGFFGLGTLMTLKRPERIRLRASEGMVITFLTWLSASLAGALAFMLAGEIPRFVNAFFETVSGFTTTGSSILQDVESMSHYCLFWRSFTHFIGGMGVLVFAFVINADSPADSVNIMKAEMPGPYFGKLVSRIRKTAMILYAIYFVMTLITFVLLCLGGMPVFDAIIHAFGAAGTGGFSNKSASIGFYQSSFINWVLTAAMILFGVNFQVYFLSLRKGLRQVLRSEELRWYLGIYLTVSLLVTLGILRQSPTAGQAFEHSFFTVSSIMSTTGYATQDFTLWPLVSQVLLLLVMMIGASAGSTGGGLKVSRFIVYLKSAREQIFRSRDQRQVMSVRIDGQILPESDKQPVLRYLSIYLIFLALGTLLLSLESPDLMTAFSAAATAVNNVGPGLSSIGPTSNFSAFSDFTKMVLSFLMLAGRLEFLPFLLFVSPKTWRRTS